MADERDAMAADIEHHNDDEAVPCRQGFSARECLCLRLWMWIQMGVMGRGKGKGGGSSLLLMLLIQFDFCL